LIVQITTKKDNLNSFYYHVHFVKTGDGCSDTGPLISFGLMDCAIDVHHDVFVALNASTHSRICVNSLGFCRRKCPYSRPTRSLAFSVPLTIYSGISLLGSPFRLGIIEPISEVTVLAGLISCILLCHIIQN